MTGWPGACVAAAFSSGFRQAAGSVPPQAATAIRICTFISTKRPPITGYMSKGLRAQSAACATLSGVD